MPGLKQVSFTDPYAAEQMDILRRQKLAEALQMQGMAQMGGTETAPGGWAIKRSPMEGLGKIAQSMTGAYLGQKASEDAKALGERTTNERSQALARALQMMEGTPAHVGQQAMPTDQEGTGSFDMSGTAGPPVQSMNVPAVAPNPMGGMKALAMSNDRALQQFGMQGAVQQMMPKPPIKGGPGDTFLDPRTLKPLVQIPHKPEVPKEHVMAGKVYRSGSEGLTNLGGPGEKIDYNKPFLPDGSPNPAYQAYAQKTARAGATNVTVDNKAEGAYAGKVAGEAGEADRGQFKAAQASVENLHKIDTVLNHLKTSDAKTGLGAELLLNVERAKTFLGAGSKTVSDTELLDTMLGSEVFPMIQTLGIGARGMDTPAEREFLRKVMAGTITLNKDTLIRMTEMRKGIAQRTLDNFNKRVDSGELDRFFKYSGMPKQKLQGPTPKRRQSDKETPPPSGITQQEWNAMRPEDRALWK